MKKKVLRSSSSFSQVGVLQCKIDQKHIFWEVVAHLQVSTEIALYVPIPTEPAQHDRRPDKYQRGPWEEKIGISRQMNTQMQTHAVPNIK